MKDYISDDGHTCKYLTPDFLCSIYDHRPPICNTDLMFERVYSRYMTREEFDKLNKEACIGLTSVD